MNPIVEQEEKKGNKLFPITENICAEVSKFKGKTYVGIRKWYEKDGVFYRSKNGLNVELDDWNDTIAGIEDINTFIQGELKK